ncbi:MAG: hypothetical protein JSS15_04320 [Proteobacteria bacterium]|nr:hypothetical protein [Pseudomonadota bacterium]
MEPPPSRYRVVERGRRLEVIDTRATAAPAARSAPATASSSLAGTPPARSSAATGRSLTTMRLYDEKAPRIVRLDAAGAATLGRMRLLALVIAMAWLLATIWQPWFGVLPLFLLARNGLGATIRRRVTRWLDRYEIAKP